MNELNDLVLDNPRYQPGAVARQAAAAAASEPSRPGMFGPEGFKFSDFLDIINPLQHIPIVSTIYRAVTGDKIEPGARFAGDLLFGGPIGLVASVANAMVQESTGKDIGEQAFAMVGIDLGGDKKPGSATEVAAATPAAEPQNQAQAQQQVVAQAAAQEPSLGMTVRSARPPENSSVRPDTADTAEAIQRHQTMSRELAEQEMASRNAIQKMFVAQKADQSANPQQGAQGDPAAILAAMSQRTRPGARSVAGAAPPAPPQVADGRAWYPAFPQGGGGANVRAVGTQAVTPQSVTSKFGSAKASLPGTPTQDASAAVTTAGASEWADRAASAYQKYFDMQQQADRTRALDVTH